MLYKYIEVSVHDNTAFLRLNRPEVRNALNRDMTSEIIEALDTLDKQASVRFMVMEGIGGTFCSGADLNWMKSAAEAPYDKNFEDSLLLATCINNLFNSEKITIAKVIGDAYGGGVGLVAACDFAYAETRSVFSFSEVNLGLVPSLIMPYVFQKTGIPALKELILTGRKIRGDEALEIGLINKSFDEKENLDDEVNLLILNLSKAAPLAQREIKKLVNRYSFINSSNSIINETAGLLAKIRAGSEAREGMQAFLQKKDPVWVINRV
ncbi:MAG: enoyl-CoA hydratase/isomerase family protein [Bacteroidales bacterium]|nr:enoyl-CoA hydratase/isomerase family protein [Bacteroidales bacterium]